MVLQHLNFNIGVIIPTDLTKTYLIFLAKVTNGYVKTRRRGQTLAVFNKRQFLTVFEAITLFLPT